MNHLRHQCPITDIVNRIQTLKKDIHDDIQRKQQTTWKKLLSTVPYKTNSSKLWKLTQNLNNTYTDTPDTYEAITTNRNTILSLKEHSNLLNKHYASIYKLLHDPIDNKIDRVQHKQPSQNNPRFLSSKHEQKSNRRYKTHVRCWP